MRKLDELKENGYIFTDLENLRKAVLEGNEETKEQDLQEIDEMIASHPNTDPLKKEFIKRESKRKVAELVKELVGNRSIRKTAADTGVTTAYIAGIIKEKYLPSAEILAKLAAPEANPQNHVTLEDLMIAAGYQNEDHADYIGGESLNAVKKKSNDAVLHDELPIADFSAVGTKYAEKRREFLLKTRRIARAAIIDALCEKDVEFRTQRMEYRISYFDPDIALNVYNSPVKEWWLYVRPQGISPWRLEKRRICDVLAPLLLVEPSAERKISLIVYDQYTYEALVKYADRVAYKGELSVILVDMEQQRVVLEKYLSHYGDDGEKMELYIV